MEKIILSLKNLYKMLMTKDFPIYSESVISEKERKGQTVLRFWQHQIIGEFRCLPYGKMIWRSDGKRNRYTSHLCNRSTELKCYPEYAGELGAKISEASLQSQISRFTEFLSGSNYKHDALMRRIREMIRLLEADDPRFSEAISAQLREGLAADGWIGRDGAGGNLYQAGYLLTLMTVYAAAGEAMDSPALAVLRNDAYSIQALWAAHREQEVQMRPRTAFLTHYAGALQASPLPQHRFFGREEELYDLQEMAAQNRKCLISGIGGIGKTELLRQLIRLCDAEKIVDHIAVVPYETGIMESFARAFPEFQREEPEGGYRQILYRLAQRAEQGERVLLLIDDLDQGLEEDPALAQLTALPCGVLITSRRSQLEGFEVYRIQPPSHSTSTLIFRNNYGQPLHPQERDALAGLLEDDLIRHPLTLRLLARAARSRNWSVAQLREHLLQKNAPLTWKEEERTVRLNQLYSQLYSLAKVPEACQAVVELFTLLPGGSYSRDFLESVFPEVMEKGDGSGDKLETLSAGGWLEETDSGFYMHPLVAQCLRRKVITEQRIDGILRELHRQLPEMAAIDENVQHGEGYIRIGEILVHISECITGSISKELMLDILTAMGLLVLPRKRMDRYGSYLERLLRRCPEQDTLVRIRYHTILGNWQFVDTARIEGLYRSQKEALTVPRRDFIGFCLANAPTIVYENAPLAVEMMSEALKEDAAPKQYALACYDMSACCYHEGDTEGAIRWSREGMEYAIAHPECGEDLLFSNMAALCVQYLRFARHEEAEPLLRKLGAMVNEKSLPLSQMKYADMMGMYSRNLGRLEEALEYFQRERSLILEYRGQDVNYYCTLVSIGKVQRALKRWDEAMENYRTALDYFRKDGDDYYYHIVSVCAAQLRIAQEKPEEALPHLEEAMAEARKQSGAMLGVTRRIMAQAYEMLGEKGKARDCLQEAVAALEEAYGPEHPETASARQWLEELTQ